MMVRRWGWTELDVYRFYNADHLDYPNLPPPPNPAGLQTFMMACLEVEIDQVNNENDPDGKARRKRRQEQAQNSQLWDQVKSRGSHAPY